MERLLEFQEEGFDVQWDDFKEKGWETEYEWAKVTFNGEQLIEINNCMNTEIKSVTDILKNKFPNAEQLDWFIPIIEAMEAYHNQFKSEPNEVLEKAIDWCNKQIKDYYHPNQPIANEKFAAPYQKMKTYLQSLKQ